MLSKFHIKSNPFDVGSWDFSPWLLLPATGDTPATTVEGVEQNVSYCSCAFLGVPSVDCFVVVLCCHLSFFLLFVNCLSVVTSGTDRAIIALPEPHCAIPPLQPYPPKPSPHWDPPSLPSSCRKAFPALSRHGGRWASNPA